MSNNVALNALIVSSARFYLNTGSSQRATTNGQIRSVHPRRSDLTRHEDHGMDTEYHFALVGSQVFDDPPCRRNGGPRRAANCRGASIRPCSSCDVFSRWMTSARCAEWSPWSPRTSVGATSSRSGQGRFLAGRCRLCRACRGSDGADRNRGPRASAPCRRVLRVAPTGDDAGPHPRRFVGTPADGLAVSRLVTEAASEVFPSIVREVGQARIDLGRNLSDAQGGRDHRRRGRPISPHAEPSTFRRAHGCQWPCCGSRWWPTESPHPSR